MYTDMYTLKFICNTNIYLYNYYILMILFKVSILNILTMTVMYIGDVFEGRDAI